MSESERSSTVVQFYTETKEPMMRVGFALGNIGPISTAENLVKIAQRAEALAYDSLWTVDRLLWPVAPQTPYGGAPDGSLPGVYKRVLDPLDALTFVAAHTKRIALGTSVLDIPYYSPVMLARRVTTLDVLSGGRVRLGLGLGWSKDEHDAVGTPMKQRGARAEEFLAVMKAVWTTDPAQFKGDFYTLPRSVIETKPLQKPHPPIYMAAFAPAALAKEAGRDPSKLQLVVRANLEIGSKPRRKDGESPVRTT